MTRVALLTECRPYEVSRSLMDQLNSVGGNSGNNAYITALRDIFGAEVVDYDQLDNVLLQDSYDIYIVGNLSWIEENTLVPEFYIDAFYKIVKKGKKFIPISVGTQTDEYKMDFNYHEGTIKFLREISEQATIGCRGEYTASLLKQNGVDNIEVIGCPSLFHMNTPDFKIKKKKRLPFRAKVATGLTPWPNKNMNVSTIKQFFVYAANKKMDFIEQAETAWYELLIKDDENFKIILDSYTKDYSKIFFDITQWRNYAKKLDFTVGGRFHGNVIPLQAGVPAMFISIDARTQEMCEYFSFPMIKIQDFDFNTSIKSLYEQTDYTEFNSKYKELYARFEKFSRNNGLEMKK